MPVFRVRLRRPDQPAPQAINVQGYSAPEPPKLSFWDSIRDVFDANTELDKFKRAQAGQPTDYKEQQKKLGVKDIPNNFGEAAQKQLFGYTNSIQRLGNTATSFADRLGMLPAQINYGITKDKRVLDYLNNMQNSINQREQNSLLSQEATSRGDMGAAVRDVTKTAIPTGVTVGSLVTGGGLSALTPRAALPKILARGAVGGVAGTAQEFIQSDRPTNEKIAALPESLIRNTAASTLLEGAGYGGGKLLNAARGKTTPGVTAKVSQELADSGQVGNEIANVKAGQIAIGSDATGKLNKATVAKYVDDIKTGKTIDPLVVSVEDGKVFLQDGKHRLAAMKQLGITDVPVVEKIRTTRPYAGIQSQIERARNAGDMDRVMKLAQDLPEDVRAGIVPETATTKAVVDPKTLKIVRQPEVPKEPLVTVDNNLKTQIKQAIVDSDAPILDTLKKIEKQTGQTGLVDQFMYDSGLLSRSNAIANQKILSNSNLNAALRGLSSADLADLNAYATARSELANLKRGLVSAYTEDELKDTLGRLGGKYASRFDSLNKFYKDLAKDMYSGGLIDEATYKQFIANPDYIRTQRNMDDLVNQAYGKGKAYSLGQTSATQKRTGSLREMQPADLTAFERTQQVQTEIQRNQVATNLIDTLESAGLARRLTAKEAVRKNTIKRLVNGQVEIFEVPREIKEVVDNINPYQLNALQQIISAPKRVFQAGTTGLSAPFAIANYFKDQLSSGIYSRNAAATHTPKQIWAGIFNASRDYVTENNDSIWQKFMAHSGDITQFDLTRNVANAKQLSRQLRSGQAGRVGNMILHPLGSLEDLVSITEKATRFQNFRGMYNAAIKAGESESSALQKATLAAWQNSVDFNRFGQWGKTLNLLIPYFNSGIQGSRQLVRSLADRPVATTSKIIAGVTMPLVGLTAWNLSDPDRKAVYDNISEFEKENNFILIPPGPLSQNQDGTYNVWKVPMPQGISNLATPFRRQMESFANQSPTDFGKIATDIMGAFSGPINTNSPEQAVAGLIPQAIKPLVQQAANKDFFTGKDIVPDYVQQATDKNGQPIPESQKSFKYTSGSADIVGGLLNVSPIRVEKFLKDSLGRIGQYGTNIVDSALASSGTISGDKVGGVSPLEDITRRFTKVQGEYNYMKSEGGKYFDRVKAVTTNLDGNEKAAWSTLHPSNTNFLGEDIFDENKRLTKYTKAGIYLQYPKVYAADKALDAEQRAQGKPGNPLFDLTPEQLTRVLLKATLPPGSKDPELSNLYKQDWYQDYQTKRSNYYELLKQDLAKQGKTLPVSDNPYPSASPQVQAAMNVYSNLPKGTGARSAWIKSNPQLWGAMTSQWSAVDAWENKERVALGLSAIAPEDQLTGQTVGSSKSSYGKSSKSYTPYIQYQAMSKPKLKTGKPSIRNIRVSSRPSLVNTRKIV